MAQRKVTAIGKVKAPQGQGTAAKQQRQTQHLTDALIRRLPPPAEGNKITYDDEVRGLGCRVTAAGAKSFVLNYLTKGGRERRITIGLCSDWSTTDARREAKRLRHLVDEGGDPLADLEAERTAPTVTELCDRFEAEHLPRKRPGTAEDYKRMLRVWIRPHFGEHTKVAAVEPEDIDRLQRKITKAGYSYRANRVIAVVSKMFSLAVRWRMRDDNPARYVERNKEYLRKRYLSADELARLVKAMAAHSDQQAADIVRLLLLTGARRGEVLAMRWADVDLTTGTWSKPASSTKQNEPHEVPLSAPARQLLSEICERQAGKRHAVGEFVFPGAGGSGHVVELKRAWRRLAKAAGISNLRLHDLRHSYASQAASGGTSLLMIGALLGHSNPATTHRYAHLFDDPLRAATERVGAAITAAGKPAEKPVKLKRRGR
jgi:integrase